LNNKHKLYNASISQDSTERQIIFIYDELIKLITLIKNSDFFMRQALIDKAVSIIYSLLFSLNADGNNMTIMEGFYFNILKKTNALKYNTDEKLCLELIEEINLVKSAIIS